MCGRYRLSKTEELRKRFDLEGDAPELSARYNVSPEQTMPVVMAGAEKNRLELMRWGLIPFWSKEPKSVAINARLESILTKPSFREAVRFRRCLIPATGFFEWKKAAGKVPYHIHRKDDELFAFAGLHDTWADTEGKTIKTFAIITTAANHLMAPVHPRMPLILTPEQEVLWLTTAPEQTEWLLENLQPLPPADLDLYPVSKQVNSAGSEGPELILRAEDAQVQKTLFP